MVFWENMCNIIVVELWGKLGFEQNKVFPSIKYCTLTHQLYETINMFYNNDVESFFLNSFSNLALTA